MAWIMVYFLGSSSFYDFCLSFNLLYLHLFSFVLIAAVVVHYAVFNIVFLFSDRN